MKRKIYGNGYRKVTFEMRVLKVKLESTDVVETQVLEDEHTAKKDENQGTCLEDGTFIVPDDQSGTIFYKPEGGMSKKTSVRFTEGNVRLDEVLVLLDTAVTLY